MSPSAQTIITAYEDCGLSAQEIADQEELDPTAVKAILCQYSAKYRDTAKAVEKKLEAIKQTPTPPPGPHIQSELSAEEKDALVTRDEFEAVKKAYYELGMTSDNPNVRERALRFIIRDKKGYHKTPQMREAPPMNIQTFNVLIQEAKRRATQGIEEPSIEAEVVNG